MRKQKQLSRIQRRAYIYVHGKGLTIAQAARAWPSGPCSNQNVHKLLRQAEHRVDAATKAEAKAMRLARERKQKVERELIATMFAEPMITMAALAKRYGIHRPNIYKMSVVMMARKFVIENIRGRKFTDRSE
jgi:DNA-binding NtrC family response regulator